MNRKTNTTSAVSVTSQRIAARIARLILGAVLTLGASSFAAAQSQATSADGWNFEAVPYLWMAGMKGDVQAGNLPKTSTDQSFSDILDVLDMGAMGVIEARNGRWGIIYDALYMKVSDSMTTSRGPLSASADVELKTTMMAGAIAYRVSEGPTAVDVIGGVRYTKIAVDATVNLVALGLTGSASRSGNKSWTDPYLGLRVQSPVNERWTLLGSVDAGSSSTVQLTAGASYAWSPTLTGKLGYRYLSVKHDDDFLFDMEMSGPYLGVGFRF